MTASSEVVRVVEDASAANPALGSDRRRSQARHRCEYCDAVNRKEQVEATNIETKPRTLRW